MKEPMVVKSSEISCYSDKVDYFDLVGKTTPKYFFTETMR